MDFHSLTRKELQTLCKKNKIPANITNIAMADALITLENVVGLEEFINQSQSLSPEKMDPESESPSINLRSASTRRKSINADPETAQPMTRTRRTTTRRTIMDQDQENKKNLMETPAVPASRRRATAPKENGISNASTIETPLVQTNRRRQPSGSVQRTRQSVRLLENSLAELSLKEKGRAKPVKMTDVSVASFEKTNDTQVSSSLENKEEMKHVVEQRQNKVDGQEVDSQNSDYLNNHVSELIARKDDVDDDTFDDFLTDKSNKVRNEMKSLSIPVTDCPSEEAMDLEHCLAADKVSEENSEIGNVSEEIVEPTSESCVEKGMMILENVTVALNNSKVDTKELIEVSLIEAEVPICKEDETPKFVKQISHPCEENIPLSTSFTEGNPDSTTKNLVDVYVMQTDAFGNQINDGDSVSGSSKFTCRNSMSPLGAYLLPIQFPRPTPIKSSSKKQEASEKLIIVAADSKKNIDSSEMKVEFKTDKVKKNKNIIENDMMLKSLEEQSLRQLSKMLKQKMQINNQEENIVKQRQVGNTRPTSLAIIGREFNASG